MFLPSIIAGIIVIPAGILLIVFHKPVQDWMLNKHKRHGGKPGNSIARHTRSHAPVYAGVGAVVLGIVFIIYGFVGEQ